jgi:hypothetical protein
MLRKNFKFLFKNFTTISYKATQNKLSMQFPGRGKSSYNLENLEGEYNDEKKKLIDMNLEELLEFYKNSNSMTQAFFNNYLFLLCLKIENNSNDQISNNLNKKHSETFSLILNYFVEDSQNINSKDKLLSYGFFLYLLHYKKVGSSVINKIDNKLCSQLYMKYFKKEIDQFNIFEKLTFLSYAGFVSNKNYEDFFTEDFHEIINLGFFELNRIVNRAVYNKTNIRNKSNFLSFILRPYIKMALEINFTNKINAFVYLCNLQQNTQMDLQEDVERLLVSIIIDFNDYLKNKDHVEAEEIRNLNWVSTFVKGLRDYKGFKKYSSSSDGMNDKTHKFFKKFLNNLYDIYFKSRFRKNNISEDKPAKSSSIFRNINTLYHISEFDKEFMPETTHMKIISEYIQANMNKNYIFNYLIKSHMMGVFLLMQKTNFYNSDNIKLMTDLFLEKIHEFPIVENSRAFKELLKITSDEIKVESEEKSYYVQVKNKIIENLYNHVINQLKESYRIDTWPDVLSIMCFYAEERSPQTDAILDIFLQIIEARSNKNDPSFIVKFLNIYVNKQTHIFPEYKSKIILKVCNILNKEFIGHIQTNIMMGQLYLCINALKIPQKDANEIKTSIMSVINSIHGLNFSKFDFYKYLIILVEDGFIVKNSTIISLMMTTKYFVDAKNFIFNSQIQEQLILLLYSVVKNEKNEVDKEVLEIFVKYIDSLSQNSTKLENIQKLNTLNLEILVDITHLFLKKGLSLQVLFDKFSEDEKIFQTEMTKELEYFKLKELYNDKEHLKILNKILEIRNMLQKRENTQQEERFKGENEVHQIFENRILI